MDRVFKPNCCANCMRPLDDERASLYRPKRCRGEAKDVRWFRRKERDPDSFDDPYIGHAVRMRLAHLAGKGYDYEGRRLSREERAAVFERDGRRCQQCGGLGNEIDHMHGASPKMSNLQVLCRDCHNAKSVAALVPIDAEGAWVLAGIRARVLAVVPTRLADDEVRWEAEWEELMAARREFVASAWCAKAQYGGRIDLRDL